jgi:hypothetical protein
MMRTMTLKVEQAQEAEEGQMGEDPLEALLEVVERKRLRLVEVVFEMMVVDQQGD